MCVKDVRKKAVDNCTQNKNTFKHS